MQTKICALCEALSKQVCLNGWSKSGVEGIKKTENIDLKAVKLAHLKAKDYAVLARFCKHRVPLLVLQIFANDREHWFKDEQSFFSFIFLREKFVLSVNTLIVRELSTKDTLQIVNSCIGLRHLQICQKTNTHSDWKQFLNRDEPLESLQITFYNDFAFTHAVYFETFIAYLHLYSHKAAKNIKLIFDVTLLASQVESLLRIKNVRYLCVAWETTFIDFIERNIVERM